MKRSHWITRAAGLTCLVIVGFVGACDVQEPDRLVRSPVIKSFVPQAENLDAVVGDTLSFSISAIDPDYARLQFFFQLADSVVSDSANWDYVVEDTGLVAVSGFVTNGERESFIRWMVEREEPVNLPPEIVAWSPVEIRPQIIIGSQIEFSFFAEDPEGRPLTYIFTVNDTVTAGSSRFVFTPPRLGEYDIRGIVSDGEGFDSHSWELFVGAEPDSILPDPVAITRLETGAGAGELILEFTAVGDDGLEGVASTYEVRTSSVPIDTEAAWTSSSRRTGVPPSALPGETMAMVVRELKPANDVFVMVRAVDDFGNLSPLTVSPFARSKGMEVRGRIVNALTNEPQPGLAVKLFDNQDITDADGRYALTELPDDRADLRVIDETTIGDIGEFFNIRVKDYQVVDQDIRDFSMMPNADLDTPVYSHLLEFVRSISLYGTSFGFANSVWELPCSVYVPTLTYNDLDYTAVVHDQLDMWERELDRPLFIRTDHHPQVGFFFQFQDGARERYEFLELEGPNLPVLSRIWIDTKYDEDGVGLLVTVAAHEIGHALGATDHSFDGDHLMVGGRVASRSTPTQDEIILFSVLNYIPRGTDLRIYEID